MPRERSPSSSRASPTPDSVEQNSVKQTQKTAVASRTRSFGKDTRSLTVFYNALRRFGIQPAKQHPGKRWFEALCIVWGIVWVLTFGLVVVTRVYELWGDVGYMAIGLFVSVPHVAIPALWGSSNLPFIGPDPQKSLPWHQRYWAKACLWQAILSFVGNYLWTHYFYVVLQAKYTFPVQVQLNEVPVMLYLITFAYFNFYHVLTNFAQRAWYASSTFHALGRSGRFLATALLIFIMGCFTAFMEAFTIQSVPYYVIHDRWAMYTTGSVFYGIYFYVSFPMFFALEEDSDGRKHRTWSWRYTAIHALAATMLVTLILDFWRISLPHVGQRHEAQSTGPPYIVA